MPPLERSISEARRLMKEGAPLHPDVVQAFLRSIVTKTAGQLGRAKNHGRGFTTEPNKQQSTADFVALGRNEKQWQKDYADPRTKEVSDRLKKEFPDARFDVSVDKTGRVFVIMK